MEPRDGTYAPRRLRSAASRRKMKAVITNTTRQHAEIHYWRATIGDRRLDSWRVPMGESTEVNIPSTKDDNQVQHVQDQCRTLGLSFREGTL